MAPALPLPRSAASGSVASRGSAPGPVRPLDATAGADPVEKLTRALAELRAQAALPLLAAAMESLNAGRLQPALDRVGQVLDADPGCGLGWHVLALCRERIGDLHGALEAYEAALKLDPGDVDLANDLGRLAMQMGLPETAEHLFRMFVASRPACPDGPNNLGCALRDQMRYADALAVLRPAIEVQPASPLLWNTLATVVAEQGDVAGSLVFFDEALRIAPDFAKARYNRANIRLSLGDAPAALADCEAALEQDGLNDGEAAMMRFARSTMLMAAGRLGEGFEAYAARLDPRHVDVTHFALDGEPLLAETPLDGRSVLAVGEQGLGDEVMFANVLADLIAAVGPLGRVAIAVERRLVPLFRRSFPECEVGAHATFRVDHHTARTVPFARGRKDQAWTPMASLLQRFRPSLEDFPTGGGFLKPDAARVAHWRGVLAALGSGRKVGLLWKSLKINSQRSRFFSPFDAWGAVLRTPGVRFVNLQYGDTAAEIAHARDAFGVEVWTPPFDLKDDLDEVAALGCALDLVIGPANATINIAAACGAPAWFVCPPGGWPMLGTSGYPWYPNARAFTPASFGAWEQVMGDVAHALRQDASPAA